MTSSASNQRRRRRCTAAARGSLGCAEATSTLQRRLLQLRRCVGAAAAEILHIFAPSSQRMGARVSEKAYTRARSGMYLPTKFGCDRSIVVGCRSRNDRQTDRQTYKQNGLTIRLTIRDATDRQTDKRTDGQMAHATKPVPILACALYNDATQLMIL